MNFQKFTEFMLNKFTIRDFFELTFFTEATVRLGLNSEICKTINRKRKIEQKRKIEFICR